MRNNPAGLKQQKRAEQWQKMNLVKKLND